MPVTESGCWIWLNQLSQIGYGSLRISGKTVKAHRASWMVYRGSIPKGMKVLHRCDIRCCINPDHLFLGTQADNVADMFRKGRQASPRGERNGRAKLTREQVEKIRASKDTLTTFAQEFGVSIATIWAARSGDTWQ